MFPLHKKTAISTKLSFYHMLHSPYAKNWGLGCILAGIPPLPFILSLGIIPRALARAAAAFPPIGTRVRLRCPGAFIFIASIGPRSGRGLFIGGCKGARTGLKRDNVVNIYFYAEIYQLTVRQLLTQSNLSQTRLLSEP